MGAAVQPLLTTVDQYRRLAVREDVVQELHWGAVVTLTRPEMKHAKVQIGLVDLLRPLAEGKGIVASEVAFRALPEFELRGADVAFVSQARWDGTSDDDNLRGSPEVVIEVLSPSNSRAEMREKAALCLSTGSVEFWLVDPGKRTVTVTRSGTAEVSYGCGSTVPVSLLGGAEIPVESVFGGS